MTHNEDHRHREPGRTPRANRTIYILLGTKTYTIEACDFMICPDGTLAIRDENRENLTCLAPENWDRAYYEGYALTEKTSG